MKKFSFILIFLIFSLAIAAVASEEVSNIKTQFELIINATDSGNVLEIQIDFPSDAGGTVNFTVNNRKYEVNVSDGHAKLNVSGLSPGNYIIKANYSGDGKYLGVENQTNVTIGPIKNTTDDNSTNNTQKNNNTSKKVVNNTSKKVINSTKKIVNNTQKNNTKVAKNQTPPQNNTTEGNVTTVVDNPPVQPKKVPDNQPFQIDAKTGIPIILVIIAAAILIAVRKYDF